MLYGLILVHLFPYNSLSLSLSVYSMFMLSIDDDLFDSAINYIHVFSLNVVLTNVLLLSSLHNLQCLDCLAL